MPRGDMKKFDNIYSQMPPMDRIAEHEAQDFGQLHTLKGVGGPLTTNEQDRVLAAVEALRTDDRQMWGSVKVIIQDSSSLGPLEPARLRRFMRNAREHYGSCAKDLPANFPKNIPPDA